MAVDTNFVSAFGAGSGVDTKSLAKSLVDAERAPKESLINRKIEKTEARISGYGAAMAILNNLKTAFQGLNDATDFNSLAVSTGGSNAFGATATSSALPGAYSVEVLSLAKAQRSMSDTGFAAATTSINGGAAFSLSLAVNGGDPTTIRISAANATAGSVVGAINAAGLGVTAQLLNTGAANDPFKIVLTGETGATNSFTMTSDKGDGTGEIQTLAFGAATASGSISVAGISVDVAAGDTAAEVAAKVHARLTSSATFVSVTGRVLTDNGDGTLTFQLDPTEGYAPDTSFEANSTGVTMAVTEDSAFVAGTTVAAIAFSAVQSASDASIEIDGVGITRTTNNIADAIPGVTLNLTRTTSSAEVLTLTRDLDSVRSKFEGLVTAYNDAMSDLDILTGPKNTEDPEDVFSGSLANDSTARGIRNKIRALFTGASSTPGAEVSTLRDLGISITREGKMELKADELTAALESKFDAMVLALSANTNNQSELGAASRGLAGDAIKSINDMLKTDGVVMAQTNSANKQLDRYKKDLESLETRMEALLARYSRQFGVMDSIVGQANATRDSLKGTFEAMMAAYKN
ncbi:MAG: flagellar filament capping protein FliD [Burkholderiaceae bacterium]